MKDADADAAADGGRRENDERIRERLKLRVLELGNVQCPKGFHGYLCTHYLANKFITI